MSIAQKSLAVIASLAVAGAVVFSLVATIGVAEAETMSHACPHTFSTNLKMGSSGAEVMALQLFLNSDSATMVASAGVGSPGMETTHFGGLTKAAVIKFQNKNAADVLTPVGLTAGTGFFGASSRAKANSLCSTAMPGPNPTPTPAPGTGLAVAAGTQPVNSLSPQGAQRVPFTRFTLTAGNDGDVVVKGVVIQKTGFGQDAAFAGIVLVDETAGGMQLDIAKTFNSLHQATVGGTFTVPKGTTHTFLVAGNMASSLTSYVGEAPSISVVSINTTATVSGTLPIVGANNTNNNTLTVATLTLASSNAFSSNATNTSLALGTAGYKFTGIALTANSAEDVSLKSIRWNQVGSVGPSDVANVATVVNGTTYPAVASADGKYYTSTLGAGLVIPKGNRVEVYVIGDAVGTNSSSRTIQFHLDKSTDIFGVGQTYGYGAAVSGGSSGTPYFYGMTATISGASITSIAKANEVPAQNIAVNVPNQPLGGYVVDLKGEDINVGSTVMTIASTTGSGVGLLTSVSIVDENGVVVAGPVDPAYTSSLVQTATFTDTITYHTGRHVYTVKGKVASGIGNGGTYIVTTVPSTGWTSVKGNTTGNSISLSGNGSFTLNTMTVKAATMAIGRSTTPASQNIVPGGSQVLFVNFQFDATQSGEDVRFASIPTTLTYAVGAVSELTSCQIYDGATTLTTGGNVVNPTGSSAVSVTFTLDNPVTVTKGTVKTLGLRCNVSGNATNLGTWAWDLGAASTFTFSGANSGTTFTGTDASDNAVTMTVGTGAAAVSIDSSAPSYTLAAAGATDVPNTAIKIRATNEDVNLTKLGLQLTNSASSSSGDLSKASIWDGATKIGEAVFTGSNTTATSTFTSPLTLTKNVDKVLTIKVSNNPIVVGGAATSSGHYVTVDYLNGEGTGAQSGTTIFTTGSAAGNGFRVFASYPTIVLESGANALSTTGLQDGRLMRFRVTANANGPVGITQFVLNVATTTANVTNLDIRAFTDPTYATPVSGVSTDGSLQATPQATIAANQNGDATTSVQTAGGTATTLQIPAGQTRYFEVYATITGDATGAAVTTKLLGNNAFPTIANVGATVNPLLSAASTVFTITAPTGHFIWSPNSTTTAIRTDQDWTNGYGVPGLPAGGLLTSRGH